MFYNHMPAIQIREQCSNRFAQSFKFAFERHPVDKCLSHFAMLLNSPLHREEGNLTTWEKYLERGQFPIDTNLYTDAEGRLIINKLYKYEEINNSLANIAAKTGLEHRPLVIREKSGFRYQVPTFADIMAKSDHCEMIWRAFESTLRFVDYS